MSAVFVEKHFFWLSSGVREVTSNENMESTFVEYLGIANKIQTCHLNNCVYHQKTHVIVVILIKAISVFSRQTYSPKIFSNDKLFKKFACKRKDGEISTSLF